MCRLLKCVLEHVVLSSLTFDVAIKQIVILLYSFTVTIVLVQYSFMLECQ